MYKVISNKKSVVVSTSLFKELNLDWEFETFYDAYKFYENYVKEHASHIGTICATSIKHHIQLVICHEESVVVEYELYLSN